MFRTWFRWFALFVTVGVVTLVGVVAFFRPIAESDVVQGPPVPAPVAFAVYVGLCVALYEWLTRTMQRPVHAAFAMAAIQFALVVDLTLRGERGVRTALASAVLLGVTWAAAALVRVALSRAPTARG